MSAPLGTPRDLAEHESRPIALAWMAAAKRAVAGFSGEALLRSALETNFAWANVRSPSDQLHHIRTTLASIESILCSSARTFADASCGQALAIHVTHVPPVYAVLADRLYFTPEFKRYDPTTETGFGPTCRAAMLIHETVHLLDSISSDPEIDIPEWNLLFESRTPEQQLHNPSAYASFLGQIHARRFDWPAEARYGAGNPAI